MKTIGSMKRTLLTTFAVAMGFSLFAQLSFDVEKIEASDVPDVVISEHESRFTEDIRRWEKHTTVVGEKTTIWYVAIFSIELRTTRSRYDQDGTAISATTYYLAWGMPQEIKDHVESNHPDYKLASGERITIFDTDKVYWRIRARDGLTKVVYYMEDGVWEEIENEDILKVLKEDENVETK